ncbi:valine--tRNA ligase [Candidatus Woesearchaeota archaeon]|nr:valine--tRNA ligase [Candidatus Woesearchaeota archaeon]
MDLPKNYDIKESEKKWQKYWEKEEVYKFNPDSKAEVYSIDTPPPTISGRMHIGHSFSFSQQDFVARFQRMLGKNVFYPFGTDDNGLPTIRLIESIKKVKGTEMKRKDFIKLCLKTLEEIRPSFIQDWKNIGMSCDFSIYYTTINEHCQRISQKSFIDLYKTGREYRKRTPFMWCPECQTAIAQVEMEDKEKESQFVYMKFDTTLGEKITIATTRPELMPACVMVHVHPKDKRYKKFIGGKAKIPFFNREVDIMANEDIDMEFGSGAVYHCTFGDMDDARWVEEFNIQAIEIMNKDGTLNEKAGKYKGMKSEEARQAIIKDLEKAGRIEKTEPIKHVVNVHERCNTDIEILMTDQWFIKYLGLKEHFLKAGKKLNWHPEHMRNRYDNWVKGLKWDWCISRQRDFGIPIPVWYCKKCKEIILPDEKDLPVDPTEKNPKKPCKCGSKEFIGEKDTLDTWATSSLTPQITAELFKGKKIYDKLYPMSLRPQAHDIITFWLFNTVVKSQLHNDINPWQDVMISGWALDPHGKKMSKSKGNVVEPQSVLEKYGADCLRFWAAGSKLGEDLSFQEKDLVTGKKFIVKIWNASKFVFMHLNDYKMEKPKKLELIDRWLLSKLTNLINSSTKAFEKYEYSRTKLDTENFFWHTFCDNYLEIAKDRLYNADKRGKESRISAQYTLHTTLLAIIKLMAPIMPYITEEIYDIYYKKHEKDKSIHLSKWPSLDLTSKNAEATGDFAVHIIREIRKAKAEKNLSLKSPVKKIIAKGKISKEEFESVKEDIIASTNTEEIIFEKLDRDSKIDEEVLINI